MVLHLPVNGFQWLTEEHIASINVKTIPDNAEVAYVFTVNLEYNPKFHDKMSNYPLKAENLFSFNQKWFRTILKI